jgi:uncharacterized protein YecT (DUF1311 family)
LAVGASVGIAVTLVVLAGAVFVGSRDSKQSIPARSAPRSHVIYTLRQGDVVRDPLTATQCEASAEGGSPNLFCTRTVKGRYQIVFYKDAVLVFDLENRTRDPLEADYTFDWISPNALKAPAIHEAFTRLSCPTNPLTTIALEGCAERAILSTDRSINVQAKTIFGFLKSRGARVSFIEGELAWVRYRRASCAAETSSYAGGSVQPVFDATCAVSRNRSHLSDLRVLRDTLAPH